jgi:hypothetical protein
MQMGKKKERTVTGIVIPEAWDLKNNVIGVAIKTLDYREYVVEHNKIGKQLLSLIDSKVRVRGTVRERLDGDIMICVKSFERDEEE